jgi:membrane protease YdiL (CAAX protease family)
MVDGDSGARQGVWWPPSLRAIVTWACLGVVLYSTGTMARDFWFHDPSIQLAHPVRSLLIVHERALDEATADDLPEELDRARRALAASWSLARSGALPGDQELFPALALHLSVVRAEGGDLAGAIAVVSTSGDAAGDASAVLAFAYGKGERPDGAAMAGLRTMMLGEDGKPPGTGWALDRLTRRFEQRAGNAAAAREVDERLAARREDGGRRWAINVAMMLVAVAGAGLLLHGLRRGRIFPPLAQGTVTPPWTLGQGATALVYAQAVGTLVVHFYAWLLAVSGGYYYLRIEGMVMGICLLLVLRHQVLQPFGVRLTELFGLKLTGGLPRLLRPALILTSIVLGLDLGIPRGLQAVSIETRWNEDLVEAFLYGSLFERSAAVVDLFLAAPFFEELFYRGVLYTSLRTRLAPWPAAAVSAAIYALGYFCSLPFSLSIFLGGIASALVYERTRSLWPAIAAHLATTMAGVLWRL